MRRTLLVLLACLFLNSCKEHHADKKAVSAGGVRPPTPIFKEPVKQGEWLKHIDQLDTTDSCIRKVLSLKHYLDTETLSRTYTFERYKVNDTLTGPLAPLDTKSSRTAHAFRTNIGYELSNKGVNFAGKYSLVGVGMTGWGENFWIVDRTSGRAYDFPYYISYMRFKKNSNLIIVHSREPLLYNLQFVEDPKELCEPSYPYPLSDVDLRPTYLLWKNNKLILLAQKHNPLLIDDFWKSFFRKR